MFGMMSVGYVSVAVLVGTLFGVYARRRAARERLDVDYAVLVSAASLWPLFLIGAVARMAWLALNSGWHVDDE